MAQRPIVPPCSRGRDFPQDISGTVLPNFSHDENNNRNAVLFVLLLKASDCWPPPPDIVVQPFGVGAQEYVPDNIPAGADAAGPWSLLGAAPRNLPQKQLPLRSSRKDGTEVSVW